MRVGFVNTVSALCYSIVRDESQRVPSFDHRAVSPNAVVNFVLEQHGRMPDYLRLPLFALTVMFDVAGLGHAGALFHRSSPAARRRQIDAWRASRLGLARDFVRLYESLAVFCWYSMVVPHDQIPAEATVAVHDRPGVHGQVVMDTQLVLPLDQPASVIADTYQPA